MGRITLITAATDTATRLTVEGGGEVLAEPHMKYILKSVDGSPLKEAISVKREGQNLQLFVDDEKRPDLTLANYFSPGMDAQLYGIADDGQLAAYASARDDGAGGALQLADGEQVPLALAGETTSEIPVISQAHDYSPSFVPWTLAAVAGGVGVLAASRHSSGGSHHSSSNKVEPPQVAISGLISDQYPVKGDIPPNGSTNDTRPDVLGTGTPNATITIYDGTQILGSTTVKADGTWSFTPEQSLLADTHSITATATDVAGHVSQPTPAFVVTIFYQEWEPQYWPASMTGSVAEGGISADGTPTLNGTTKPNATVTLYDNENKLGTTIADGDGNWSYTPATPLDAGEHVFRIHVIDDQGIYVLTPGTYSFTVDYSAGELPQVAITALVNDIYPEVGDIAPNGSTHDNQPEIRGTGTVNAVITIYDGTDPLGTTTVQEDGTWTFTPTQALTQDMHSITATATDAAGHVSQPTDAFVVTIVPELACVVPHYWPSTLVGPVADGGITADGMPMLAGKTKPNATVTLFDNDYDHPLGTTTSDQNGEWTYTLTTPLSAGEHVLIADVITSRSEAPLIARASYSLTVDESYQPEINYSAEPSNTSTLSLGDVLTHDQGDMPWSESAASQQSVATSEQPVQTASAYTSSSSWLQSHLSPDVLIQQS